MLNLLQNKTKFESVISQHIIMLLTYDIKMKVICTMEIIVMTKV